MSLIIEQRLINKGFTEHNPKIYSTGDSLTPMKVENNGKNSYVWVANEFDGDPYFDGELITPISLTNNFNRLFIK